MGDQYSPPPGSGWGAPPPPPGDLESEPTQGAGDWQTPPPASTAWGAAPPPAERRQPQEPQQPGWGNASSPSASQPQQPHEPGWGPPPPPGSQMPQPQEPAWAPPPPPAPRSRQAGGAWGAPQQPPGGNPDWGRQPAQGSWGQPPAYAAPPAYGPPPPYGAPPAYGAPPPYGAVAQAPAPAHRRRLWIILGAVAAGVIVVLVAGAIGVYALINRVPPANGATVSTSFVQLKVATGWSEAQTRGGEVELKNQGDGDMLVGYGNSKQDGISSDDTAFKNLQTNLIANFGGAVSQCVAQHGLTIGGKSGQEAGFRYDFQGTDLCEIAWVDVVSSSRYYYWNIADDYSRLSALQNENAAMQETASWKV